MKNEEPLCQPRYRLMSVSYRKAKNVIRILHSSFFILH